MSPRAGPFSRRNHHHTRLPGPPLRLPLLQPTTLQMHVLLKHISILNEPHTNWLASCKRKRKRHSRNIEGCFKKNLEFNYSIVISAWKNIVWILLLQSRAAGTSFAESV